ncbi:MAG: DUF262 domain-containing protein [Candidatus Competibacteraceae bacterium]|nr:DUF262 domain-containing protein [Candidatus Competibacteraceae bacterium]
MARVNTTSSLQRPGVERLPTILQDLHEDRLRIPKFQRPFIWSDDKRLHLLDSVKRGLPIGSLMIWSTTRHVATDPCVGPFRMQFTDLAEGATRRYLLDGRQRLTTLYATLGLAFYEQEAPALSEQASSEDWRIYYDLDKETFELAGGQNQLPSTWMPTHLLLDGFARQAWLEEQLGVKESMRVLWKRANVLAAHFNDYLIPLIPMASDSLEVVALSFKRVNQGGTEMGDFDMVHALTWNDDFDFGGRVSSLLEVLAQVGWGQLDRDWVLKAVAAEVGVNPFKFDPERLADNLKKDPSAVERVAEQFERTVALLGKLNIRGPRIIPYTHQFLFVARALQRLGDELSDEHERRIWTWVLRTSVSSALGGGGHDRLTRLLREFESWVAEGHQLILGGRARECLHYNFSHARSRILALTLAKLGPRHADGTLVEHPFDALARYGTDATPMLLDRFGLGLETYDRERLAAVPSALKSSPANRVICLDVAELRRALLGPDALADGVAESHAITAAALDELRMHRYEAFIEHRRREILRLEQQQLEGTGWCSTKRTTG